ncbi:MAG: amidohydrolase family protein [Phycisphaeraceae bacterium]
MQLDVRIDHGRIISGDAPTPGSNKPGQSESSSAAPGSGVLRSIGILDDRIVLGVNPATEAKRVIDATGLVVCPGFIDIHSHSDFAALYAPGGESKVLAGYTTELNGNCGFGAFPLYGAMKLQLMDEHALRGHDLKIDWETGDGYFRKCEQNPMTLNQGVLLGHGTLHGSIVGVDDRKATRGERQRMVRETERAMRLGCFGLSTGLVYAPGSFAERDEIVELAHVVAHHGGLYASHLRSESDQLLEALDEFLGVCEAAGCRAQYSHIKTAGPRNWHKLADVRKRMDNFRGRGVEIHGDRYPYTASCTALAVILLPNDALGGGPRAIVERLTDRKTRDELAARIRQREQIELDGGINFRGWCDKVMIGAVNNPALRDAQGKTLAKWASHIGQTDALEAAFDLLIDDHAATTGIHFSMSDDNMRTILNWPEVCIGSDSHIHDCVGCSGETSGGGLHPRDFGTPGRILGQLCRDAKWFDLPTAIHKLTGLPAKIMRLKDRGLIRDGYFADLVLFDPRTIEDRATYVNPAQPPAGIRYVFINGHAAATPAPAPAPGSESGSGTGSGEAQLNHLTPPPGRLLKFEG